MNLQNSVLVSCEYMVDLVIQNYYLHCEYDKYLISLDYELHEDTPMSGFSHHCEILGNI